MYFIVRHTDATGAQVEVEYCASNRHELHEKLSADHICPTSIRECHGKQAPRKLHFPTYVRFGFVFMGIALLALIVARWCMPTKQLAGKVKTSNAKPLPTVVELSNSAPPPQQADATQALGASAKREEETLRDENGEVTNGWVRLPNGKLHKRNGLMKSNVKDWCNKTRYQIFDHYTDNEIATLLTLKPGEMLIGGAVFPRDYEQRFLKSLETPIVISADDPDDIKDVKRGVIQTRLQLKAAMDNGESIRELVAEAYDEAQKLAAYRDNIQEAFRELQKQDCLTEADIDTFLEAANLMLEGKGIAPIKIGPLMKARLLNLKK